MMLPIDARNAPFKEKYIDQETPMLARWFVMGMDRADGTVWVMSADVDVLKGLTLEQAGRIVRAREAFVNEVLSTLNNT